MIKTEITVIFQLIWMMRFANKFHVAGRRLRALAIEGGCSAVDRFFIARFLLHHMQGACDAIKSGCVEA